MQLHTSPKALLVALMAFLPVSLGACGGSADAGGGGAASTAVNPEKGKKLTDKGMTALNSGDYAGAVESFEKAVGQLEAGSPEYMRAKAGEIEALIHVDAERAKTQMLALGPKADENMYTAVASKMCSAKRNQEAVAVLDAGIKLYPESPQLKAQMDKVIAEAQKQGDAGALDSLKGLGYLGGD
jgi:hypothetical protein